MYPIPSLRARPSIILMASLLLVSPLLAGCVGGEGPNDRFAGSATGGVMFLGVDYGAETLAAVNSSLEIDVDAVLDTGTITAKGTLPDNVSFEVEATRFQGAADFHEGGIVANIREHGDTGVGNTKWPEMHVLVATWGNGTFSKDGNLTKDPYTGETDWDLHLMVTDTGVRDDATGKIQNADGTGLYDPADPGNALVGNDMEAHLIVSSTYDGPPLGPETHDASGELGGMAGTTSDSFEVTAGPATIEAVVTLDDLPTSIGGYRFRLLDPNGDEQDSVVINTVGVDSERTATLRVDNATRTGFWSLHASATTGGPATFEGEISVTYAPPPTYYFFWEDVNVVQRVVQ